MNVAWAPEHDAKLTTLRDQGHSASEIAAAILLEFGVRYSRNAVLGRAHRLGLPQIPNVLRRSRGNVRRPRSIKPKVERAAKSIAAPRGRAAPRITCAPEKAKLSVVLVIDASKARPWTERRFGQCAYPISGEGADTFSCCQPAGDRGYCGGHAAVMFVAPKAATRASAKTVFHNSGRKKAWAA